VDDVPDLGAHAGDRLAGVPNFTAALALTWNYTAKSFARLDYQAVGRLVNNYDAFGAPVVPAYSFANLTLGYNAGHWDFTGRLRNVFDTYAAVSRHRSIFGQWDTTLPPRTLIVSARYSW
jgi:hypothetical protein